MTLTEIMIVIIIMAMIAAAVGAAVIPKFRDAQRRTAATDAQAIRSAAESYSLEHGTRDCPTVEELVEAGEIRRGSRMTDPWGTAFKIECSGTDIEVKSAGPDGQFGGDDDI
jgi:general secretion pathway protein G